ncbi:MAG: IS1634 family transposase [Leptolyngbya sp. BL-A-14]
MNNELIVQNLDHLGIVAGLVDELEIVEQINQHLGEDPREQISPGVAVKAMILNGLGLVSAPLYLFDQFFVGKATAHLLGAGVLAEHLNDDRLGRVLDALYLGGLSQIFVAICLTAARKFGVECKSAHFDSTSFTVEGEYLPEVQVTEGIAPVPITITYGYSRDRRPDLKQFVMNLVCWGDGDMPAFIELADGNQSDKAHFAGLMQAFKAQWHFEGLYVADAALYSEENLQQLSGLRWLTRVPLTLNTAAALVNQVSESAFERTALEGYRIATVCCDYGGVRQQWFVVESQERKKSDLKKLEQTLVKAKTQWQAQLRQLCAQEFACEADALAALKKFERTLPWHQLEATGVKLKLHYEKPGKPKRETPPSRITYHPQASLIPNASLITSHQQRAGRFILATNGVEDTEQLSPQQALEEYKGQQGNERGFRFLKDPLFFASSVFLKAPERIMALAMVMGLCLLVYNLGQRQLRQALQQADQTLPNQLRKATQRPTLRWLFQCFMAVHYVMLNGSEQIVNLTDDRRRILQFLGSTCRQYYLLG